MRLDVPKLAEKAKAKGLLTIIHIVAGSSLFVKSIIVSVALVLGYGSAAYFKKSNAVTNLAQEVVEAETGVHLEFNRKP